MERNMHDVAQLIVSCWRLSGQESLPTSHAVLDRALAKVVSTEVFPDWARDQLSFADSRVGLQCVELPLLLDLAQKAQLTAAPNPSYRTVRVLVSERAAAKLVQRLGVNNDDARRWGVALREAVDALKAQESVSKLPVTVEY